MRTFSDRVLSKLLSLVTLPFALLSFTLSVSQANAQATAGQLVISEFRLRGDGLLAVTAPNNEFIEIHNTLGSAHTVTGSGSGTGYGVAASDGVVRCNIPNGTVIPAKGHFLCVNSIGYSLSLYPAGIPPTATGDAIYTTDIPDNAGIALFNTNVPAEFALATRLDAVGSTSEANTLYKEGTGYPALTPFSIDYSFYRDNCGKQGSITTFGLCPSGGAVVDTNNNATDFIFVDTNGTSAGAGQRLGAPGPENLSSPIEKNNTISQSLIFPCISAAASPNRVRDTTPGPPATSSFGTLTLRRRFTNNTSNNITRLRFRVVDMTTFPAPPGFADLRMLTSIEITIAAEGNPCNTGPILIRATTLEQLELSPGIFQQPNGGGFNSSMSAVSVALATPIPPLGSVDVSFVMGVEQTGLFKIWVNFEALEVPVPIP